MEIVRILVGIGLLTLGRKLYWLFVAAVGFMAGLILSGRFFGDAPFWFTWLIALGAGVVGALLAVVLQGVSIGVAGFLAGGYAALYLARILDVGELAWIPFVVGGIIGAILIALLFDWAVILLSSLGGAATIVEATELAVRGAIPLFAALVVAGVVIQTVLLLRDRERKRQQPVEA